MTPEERSLLEQAVALAEDNNQMLRSIRRSGRISLAMRIGYWVVIILLSFGAYYAIQPYVQTMFDLINGNNNGENSTQSVGESQIEMLNNLLR